MGTNFYRKGYIHTDDPRFHIGKRSAAGYYCWDCKVTLCKGGKDRVHYDDDWYDKCPICGKEPKDEGWNSSAGRELGFNKTKPKTKTGVASCSSFTWARELGKIRKIQDEYGKHFTREEFQEMLLECPIQYHDSMGQEFS